MSMLITKVAHNGGETVVWVLRQFDELEVKTKTPPRPELLRALANLAPVVRFVFSLNSEVNAAGERFTFCPVELLITRKSSGEEFIKITSAAHGAGHGEGKLSTPAVRRAVLPEALQARIAQVIEEGTHFARGKRAQMELVWSAGGGAAAAARKEEFPPMSETARCAVALSLYAREHKVGSSLDEEEER